MKRREVYSQISRLQIGFWSERYRQADRQALLRGRIHTSPFAFLSNYWRCLSGLWHSSPRSYLFILMDDGVPVASCPRPDCPLSWKPFVHWPELIISWFPWRQRCLPFTVWDRGRKFFKMPFSYCRASLVKIPPAVQKTWVRSLGWEDPLEKGMTTHNQSPGLENSMACLVHGVAKSRTRLSNFHFIIL